MIDWSWWARYVGWQASIMVCVYLTGRLWRML